MIIEIYTFNQLIRVKLFINNVGFLNKLCGFTRLTELLY